MILALGLLSLTGALLLRGPAALTRWAPSERRPLASLAVWQLVSWSAVGGVAAAAALLALPWLTTVGRFPAGLESCLVAIDKVGNPADNPVVQGAATVLLAGLLLRVIGCATINAASNYRSRSRHRVVLSLVGEPDACLGVRIVHDETALVYCLPGRGGCVVFTSAAMEKLSVPQRDAVLAHERAHLRERHHLLVASASLLVRAFPGVRLFRRAFDQTRRLVEMRADDLALRGHSRRSVAEALVALADVGSSGAVLAASGVTTAARVERLLGGPVYPDLSLRRRLGHAAGMIGGLALLASSPILLAAAGHAALCLI